MEVTRAKVDDIDVILAIIEEARTIMRENGNLTQWADGYPSRETILGDIANGDAFVCKTADGIAGYFCFIVGDDPDPNYRVIESGQWLDNKPYGVIHRLASGRQVKGIAQTAFDFAFSQIKNIRVDTHHDNLPMQNFLKKDGFVYCGIIYVSDGTPRDAFQKQL
jgi:ribosomal protein S18 acetylase RimI-like enzyme